MSNVKTVALELQPALGKRSGIGNYTYELAKRLQDDDNLQFCGNVFNFQSENDLPNLAVPIRENKKLAYGVYRRLWHWLPVRYDGLFPAADLSIFFNYIVPPRISGKVMTTIHDLTWLRYPKTMDSKNLQRIKKDIDYSINRADKILTVSGFSKQEMISLLKLPAEQIVVVPCAAGEMPENADCQEVEFSHALSALCGQY